MVVKARPPLIDATITDPDVIDIDCFESKENTKEMVMNKKEIYCQRLRKWKGFVRCKYDITKVFDEFQERLKDEFEWNKRNQRETECMWDENCRYFINANGKDMPYLHWDPKTKQTTTDAYLGYRHHINEVVLPNFELNCLDRLQLGEDKNILLLKMFDYTCHVDLHVFKWVCKSWNDILSSNDEV